MDEDISIINTNTRNEKIKNFFIHNKKKIISGLSFIVILLISYFAFGEYQDRKKIKISDSFNTITINYSESNKEKTAKDFSISESAKYGGNIGWIKEEQLTRKIYNSVKVLKKGEISDAIIIDGKIIFIKKNDERTNDPNIEIVKEEIVNKEKMLLF